jgi:hypothetical protein
VNLYKEPICIFCKTFREDFDRARILLESIDRYNGDSIPIVVSVPRKDQVEFTRTFKILNLELMTDEEIAPNEPLEQMIGWKAQQVVKLAFADVGYARNYVWVDSDCIFLRTFSISDFVHRDGFPYTVCSDRFFHFTETNESLHRLIDQKVEPQTIPLHQSLRWSESSHPVIDVEIAWSDQNRYAAPAEHMWKIAATFGRVPKPHLEFLPPPVSWSSDVVLAMKQALGLACWADLIMFSPWEAIWYGEYLIRYETIPLHLRDPYFLHFSTDENIELAKRLGFDAKRISGQFLGVTLAARHQLQTRFA